MNQILELYKISFYKKLILGNYMKLMSSNNDYLSQFITDFYTLDSANELISGINSILNDEISLIDYSTESLVTLVMDKTISKIYAYAEYNSSTSYFSLPTIHLKIISEEWLDYLTK
ncbi:hypothetical protein [Parasediminibacterium sp. JCM 36343]|uniref:hypothetical protein n=1 Tax=Parasediminibacterium sp. JCM 36343 TaxID=3374279 RepID=UPI0039787371